MGTAEWYREYRFRKVFPGVTHDEFLDEPGDAVDWLLAINRMVEEVELERQEKAERDAGR